MTMMQVNKKTTNNRPQRANNTRVPNGAPSNNNGPRRRPMPKEMKKDNKYAENWINIKSIANGVIHNNSKEMITGVKIQPRNIFILDRSEMDAILIGLMNFYNTIDYEFWIIVADRPVDITMYQAELQILLNRVQDHRVRKTILQDMDKGDLFIDNDVVDTEYFIILKEKRPELLEKKVRNLITGLASCGLIASQTSNEDLRVIIDNFLNAGRKFSTGGVIPV